MIVEYSLLPSFINLPYNRIYIYIIEFTSDDIYCQKEITFSSSGQLSEGKFEFLFKKARTCVLLSYLFLFFRTQTAFTRGSICI